MKLDSKYLNRKIPLKAGTAYHFLVAGNIYAVLMRNLSEVEISQIIQSIKDNLPKKKFTLTDLFINQANASDGVPNCESVQPSTIDPSVVAPVVAVTSEVTVDYLIDQSKSCIQDVLSGAWSSTGELVGDIGEGVMSFLRSPLKSMERFWDGAVETYHSTSRFLSNIETEMKGIVSSLSQLSTETQVSMICQLVGAIGAPVLIGIVTRGPVGAAAALTQFAAKVTRLKEMVSVVKALELTKSTLPSAESFKELTTKILRSTNNLGLEKLKSLAEFNMPRLTQRYALCAL